MNGNSSASTKTGLNQNLSHTAWLFQSTVDLLFKAHLTFLIIITVSFTSHVCRITQSTWRSREVTVLLLSAARTRPSDSSQGLVRREQFPVHTHPSRTQHKLPSPVDCAREIILTRSSLCMKATCTMAASSNPGSNTPKGVDHTAWQRAPPRLEPPQLPPPPPFPPPHPLTAT